MIFAEKLWENILTYKISTKIGRFWQKKQLILHDFNKKKYSKHRKFWADWGHKMGDFFFCPLPQENLQSYF